MPKAGQDQGSRSSFSGPCRAKAKKSGPHGSPWRTPRVDAMVAAEPRSRRGVGVAYDQVAKGRRDGHLCAMASSIRWRDNVLKAFRRSSCTVTQSGSAAMPAARAWPTICAPPGTPTASCREARLGPTALQVARAHSPARRQLLQWATCHHTVWIWGEGWIGGGLARGAAFPGPLQT
jgi:hypothetical protein